LNCLPSVKHTPTSISLNLKSHQTKNIKVNKMQYLTLASLFAAALAAPAPQTTPIPECPNPAHCPQNGLPNPDHYENIDITDWSLRKNNGTIQSVYFKLSGDNATDLVCERGVIPSLPAPVVTCGDSDYRFGMVAPNSEWNDSDDFGLAIYHQTSPA
jgi:hypothetical protein